MPRYDFECPDHGEFEATVRFADSDKPQPCPVTTGGCEGRHKPNPKHVHTLTVCGVLCKRVARLYAPGVNYCDGMTKHSAVIDSENSKKYGHTV